MACEALASGYIFDRVFKSTRGHPMRLFLGLAAVQRGCPRLDLRRCSILLAPR
jgi:hypothetical protein